MFFPFQYISCFFTILSEVNCFGRYFLSTIKNFMWYLNIKTNNLVIKICMFYVTCYRPMLDLVYFSSYHSCQHWRYILLLRPATCVITNKYFFTVTSIYFFIVVCVCLCMLGQLSIKLVSNYYFQELSNYAMINQSDKQYTNFILFELFFKSVAYL